MALTKCKECGREVSTEAATCPGCGAPIKGVPTPINVVPNSQKKKSGGCLKSAVLIFIVGVAAIGWINRQVSDPNDATAEASASVPKAPTTPPVSDITWRDVNAIYGVKSGATDMQKDEQWKALKGKRVKWTGVVSSVSDDWAGFKMQVKMNRQTFTSDLIVDLRKSEKPKAIKLKQGDDVTFEATLDRWGTLLPVSLEDGEIVE